MRPDDCEKTAFATSSGLSQFGVMPFQIGNASATLYTLIESVLTNLIGPICLVYFDDVINLRNTLPEYLMNLNLFFFLRLQNTNLKLTLTIFLFGRQL